MAAKFNTYVAVFFENPDGKACRTKFVTGLEKSMALWEEGKPAVVLGEPCAKDVVYGLTLNGYAAAVVKVLNGVNLSN